ncbi:MAG: methionine adenosyltransferase [Bacilli bacterium]|nr:methionine adenosyltransferase [Bacilli bacterium]
MKKEEILFTSESVSEGHPDKICDQISDAILDAVLKQDSEAFVACECYATENFLLIGGEVKTSAKVDYKEVARRVIKDIGYDKDEYGFNYKTVKIKNLIHTQSQDIRRGVKKKNYLKTGAGDQGIMFGYASNESEGYMPLPICIAHKLVRVASQLRKSGDFKGARPDMKSQVTIDYTNETPRIKTVLMSVQHSEDINEAEFKAYIVNKIMKPVIKSFNLNDDFEVLINPTGRFVIGGPKGDAGLTGRKIIVDTYGGSARHGGGAFSGKDPSKVDRSAAYYARYMAKNLVAAGVADRLEIQLAYAIGRSDPLSISISTFKTSHYSDEKILEIINKVFDARPGAIIHNFSLRNPSFKYEDTARYGHFGRPDLDLPREKLDKVEEIKKYL